MTQTDPAPRVLLSNGNGLWFAQCRWCVGSSPAIGTRDGLRALAAAKAAGWTCAETDAGYLLICPACARQRGVTP